MFRSIVLDYDIAINNLRKEDQIFIGGSLGNYSLAGFEMILRRHVSHYIINYYLPSGLFVVVSWISFLVPADIIPGNVYRYVVLQNNFSLHRQKIMSSEKYEKVLRRFWIWIPNCKRNLRKIDGCMSSMYLYLES